MRRAVTCQVPENCDVRARVYEHVCKRKHKLADAVKFETNLIVVEVFLRRELAEVAFDVGELFDGALLCGNI